MSDDLSTASERQLEVWAFGRQGVVTDRELAEAALREIARRAEAARAEAARAEAARTDAAGAEAPRHGAALTGARGSDASGDAGGREGESEHPEPSASDRQQHRMRLTGLVGVVAAVLGLGAVGVALTTPDPDPLAIFERAETATDQEWTARLAQGFSDAITLGPRTIDLGDGIIGVAFRTAAVADGRSTEYDPYCLVTTDTSNASGATPYGGACTLPERFATDGLTLPVRPSTTGSGFDTALWGPIGAPRLEVDRDLARIGTLMSVIDWMVYPSFPEPGVDPLAFVDDPDRLLLGPTPLPLARSEASTLDIATSAYLLRGETDDAGPVLCAHTAVPDEGETTTCASLSTVQRQGLDYTITADGRSWIVSIGADGPQRTDTLRPAD
ncbi:hypothetical protein [Microcella sp.]|uniref:hypothetical protein n=1 Tax=Microcella sp. TaxID=1913979 RepID=UPI003F71185C